jgi:hypothetical protein
MVTRYSGSGIITKHGYNPKHSISRDFTPFDECLEAAKKQGFKGIEDMVKKMFEIFTPAANNWWGEYFGPNLVSSFATLIALANIFRMLE